MKTATILVALSLALANAHAATFTVTTTADTGAGSLRQAIVDANASNGLDTIAFNIAGAGVQTIMVTTLLPIITGPTIIDGYTQPGSSSNTLATGNNAGLLIEVTATNSVRGCFDITGAGSTVRGLVLNGFYDFNFQVGNIITLEAAASNCVIEGNFIGTDPTGTNDSASTTYIGVNSSSPGNRIGGSLPGARNVIGGCINQAVLLTGSAGTNNTVQGNYIGTDKTGTKAIANGRGIFIESALNQIGGTVSGAGNLVSGNTGEGLYIIASTNVVEGNLIGLAVTGLSALPNGSHGVFLTGNGTVNGNRIGGTSSAARNVISGNATAGIVMSGVLSNAVLGNFIGTDVTGSNAAPNTSTGIHMDLCVGPVISGNVIAGNGGHGISFTRGSNLQVDGNFIGTDLTGTLDLGNTTHGIDANSNANKIDIGVGAPNTIAFNGNAGITFNNGSTSNNVIGNLIYTNSGPGVYLTQSAFRTRISANSFFDNGGLGIQIGNVFTANDPCDADAGDNDLQNYPVITAASSDASSVTIAGFLPSTASTAFDLEFFANTVCDPSGFGEGEFFLGTTNVTTGANCTNNFTVTFPIAVADALLITATATDPDGNTSEFSACRTNVSTIVTPVCSLAPQLSTNQVGNSRALTVTVTTNSVPVGGLSVTFNLTGANGSVQTNITTAGNGQATFSYTGLIVGTDNLLVAGAGGPTEFACDATVVWIDSNIAPQITCPGNITTNTTSGACNRSVTYLATATGTPTPTITYSTNNLAVTSPTTFPKGVTTVKAIASNIAGTNECMFTVTVNDNVLPGVTCPSDITSNVAAGVTSSVVHYTIGGSDNCPNVTTTGNPPSGSIFNLGTTPVTVTSIDSAANTNTCIFNVTVQAAAPCSVTCPSQIFSNTAPGMCGATVTFNVSNSGTCPAIVATPASGTFFATGTTPVTVTTNGFTACTFPVTVTDTQKPTITCPGNITTNLPAGVTNAVVNYAVTVSDNCGVTATNFSIASGATFALGTTNVVVIAADTAGNTSTCSFNIVVSPAACACPDITGTWSNLVQTCKFKDEVPACKVKGRLLVSNIGCVDAPTSFIRYYLSDDAVFDEGDTFLKQVATGTIKLDKPKKRTLSAKLPAGVNGSGQFILAVLDAAHTLDECAENNNIIVFGPLP